MGAPPAAPAQAAPPAAPYGQAPAGYGGYPGYAPPTGTSSNVKALVLILVLAVVGIGVIAAFTVGPLGGGAIGDCVLRYQFEGIVRHEGWTRSECDAWCADHLQPQGRALECWFEG